MNTMNNYVGDELANKVKVLSVALSKAEKLINKLEQENNELKNILSILSSDNSEIVLDSEVIYS